MATGFVFEAQTVAGERSSRFCMLLSGIADDTTIDRAGAEDARGDLTGTVSPVGISDGTFPKNATHITMCALYTTITEESR